MPTPPLPRPRLTAPAATLTVAAAAAAALTAPAAPAHAQSVLFVRGADRSGGFLEAGNDADRTEQLADINNFNTTGGNHGWGAFATLLRSEGYSVEQVTESVEAGAGPTGPTDGVAVDFTTLNLSQYDAVVFGSNNAAYNTAQVDAVEDYIRGGGGALFISDANFGGDWADASNSDQAFLDRFGLIAHQDQGTYALERNSGDFAVPDHPLFAGVNAIDGEGVTPIRLGDTAAADVEVTLLANAQGQTRLNEPPFGGQNQGPSRAAGPDDAAVLVAQAGAGRIVGHFDRNTFFNENGAGTDITRFDNDQFALNVFEFLTVPEPASALLLAGVLPLAARRRR